MESKAQEKSDIDWLQNFLQRAGLTSPHMKIDNKDINAQTSDYPFSVAHLSTLGHCHIEAQSFC